jgi:hypothetical protein
VTQNRNNKLAEKEIKKIIQFTMATKIFRNIRHKGSKVSLPIKTIKH